MPFRFDEFSRRILHGFESPSNDESHEQFAFLSLCFSLFYRVDTGIRYHREGFLFEH